MSESKDVHLIMKVVHYILGTRNHYLVPTTMN